MEIKLTAELVQNILNYLGQRPFIEVAKLIEELMKQAQSKVEDK
jgi:hypothetical protein